ncbi:hypothetical protein TMatcc_000441 [Talaromyces marneffei ATCC 18224]
MSSRAFSPFSTVRTPMMIFDAPRETAWRVVSNPIPVFEPVTRTVWPWKEPGDEILVLILHRKVDVNHHPMYNIFGRTEYPC